jgi:hypothetical protein
MSHATYSINIEEDVRKEKNEVMHEVSWSHVRCEQNVTTKERYSISG